MQKIYRLFVSVVLVAGMQFAAKAEVVSDAQILRRVSTIHIFVDAPAGIKEKITACFVGELQKIPSVSFVREFGYNPTVDAFAPYYVFRIVATRIAEPPQPVVRLAISTLVQEPFHSEQMFGILNKSTTTGAPLFSEDVLHALNFMAQDLERTRAYWLNISAEGEISTVCRTIASKFDSTILEKQRQAIRRLRQQRSQ